MRCARRIAHRGLALLPVIGSVLSQPGLAAEDPEPGSHWPALLGAQYTYVLQHQDALDAPYTGRLSLRPDGDTQPTADGGETGVFLRLGWNDGKTESFAFTEIDNEVSTGMQWSGVHWWRKDDRLGAAVVSAGLSAPHREYLAAGGSGFLLDDGRLRCRREQTLEIYYRAELTESTVRMPVKAQLSPDFQFIRNPGFNAERGPARFWGVRLHLEY